MVAPEFHRRVQIGIKYHRAVSTAIGWQILQTNMHRETHEEMRRLFVEKGDGLDGVLGLIFILS